MDVDSDEFFSFISEWCVNLQKSWQNFMDSFIIVCCCDEMVVLLLVLNQDIYLWENICFCLLVVVQVVLCYQEEIWKQLLDNVLIWVCVYYDIDDVIIKVFFDEVDKFSQ